MINIAKLQEIKDEILRSIEFNEIKITNKYEVRKKLRNVDVINPMKIEEYIARDGYLGLYKSLNMTPEEVIQTMKESGLRGRGGAGFPTGLKWQFAFQAPSEQKYIIVNADEGIPGDFMDRILLEKDPHSVIEGMMIAAVAIGASKGYIYLRKEYPTAKKVLDKALADCYKHNILGSKIFDTDFIFDVEIRLGAGAYICGEETALIESIEGKKGQPRLKPPFPVVEGLYNKPTVVNNVETLSIVPQIICEGGSWFKKIGNPTTPGTKIHTISGKVKNPGYYELPTGLPVRVLFNDIAGGMKPGYDFKAVLFGGPSGGFLREHELFRRTGFDTLARNGVQMGAGGLIFLSQDNDIVSLCRSFAKFNQNESCGRCVPCREGTVRLHQLLSKIEREEGVSEDLIKLEETAIYIINSSFCGLGQSAANTVLSGLEKFRDEFEAKLINNRGDK